jgi:hypothetical protein
MLSTFVLVTMSAHASSHREAPAIALDPAADLTDFYAFVSPEDASKVVFIMNTNPLELPGGGPNFHRFDDDVTYGIRCDNEGDGIEDVSFAFRFTTTYQYPDEFLYNLGDIADPTLVNHTQTMSAYRIDNGVRTTLVTGAPVGPANVGLMSDPTDAYTPESSVLSPLTSSLVTTAGAYRFFAGPRQDGFFVDLERTFDLLNLNNPDNKNTLKGYNVHSIAIEVPAESLLNVSDAPVQNQVIACWAATARNKNRVPQADGDHDDSGVHVQVARLGNPLVNEVVIPVGQKDIFNGSQPRDDLQFLTYVTNPILPVYMEAILGIPNPISYDAGLGIGGREDLVQVFLTGHPALGTLPDSYVLGGPIPGEPGKVFAAFEALRLNVSLPSGFPNGRLVTDDVVDTALSAMAGLLINGTVVSDGVDASGLYFLDTFPFLGDPWTGDDHPNGTHDL